MPVIFMNRRSAQKGITMRFSIGSRIYLYFIVSVALTSIAASSFFFLRYRGELDSGIDRSLTAGAAVAKGVIDLSKLGELHNPDYDKSEYYIGKLRELKNIEKGFGFLYVYGMVKEDGKYRFVYDSSQYEPDKDTEYTFFKEYNDYPPALDQAWKGGSPVTSEYTDQWGRVRSIFYPVKDASGNVVIMIAVDYSIETVRGIMVRSYYMFGGIAGFIILVTFFVAQRLRRKIVAPISTIVSEVTAISDNADLTMRTSVRGNDELGELSRSFNNFLEKSQGIVKQISEISMRLAASSEEFSSISMNLSQSKTGFTSEASRTAGSITELIARITSLSKEQLELFESLRSIIDNLCKGINTVDGQAERTLAFTSEVSAHAQEGGESISTMNESMAKVMKSSEDMIGIIEIINDISDRINLLSLNAAIEAARAGDAGKGFAVVAEEISKLADQTASSTKNIDSLIRANSAEISKEMSDLDQTTSILKRIIEGIGRMKDEVTSISTVAGEQLETAEQVRLLSADIYLRANEVLEIAASQQDSLDAISSSISNIDEYTSSVTTGAEEIAASSSDIATMAETLNEKVSLFRV